VAIVFVFGALGWEKAETCNSEAQGANGGIAPIDFQNWGGCPKPLPPSFYIRDKFYTRG